MLVSPYGRLSKWLHWLFEASLVLKGAFAAGETLSGLGLLLTPHGIVLATWAWMTNHNLTQNPNDAMALWFRNFSTWDGVAGIHLEDLYVRERFRRRGLARALLAALARECVENDYSRLSWAVLDWNTDAIALYDAVGGRPLTEWIGYRVSGPELSALAAASRDVSH